MKKSFLILGFVVQGFLLQGVLAQGTKDSIAPRFAERMLSDYYENISKEALHDVLPTNKFKLLIDVAIDDPAELSKLSTDKYYLPMPGTTKNNSDISKSLLLGDLESINQRRSVLMILDPEYAETLNNKESFEELIRETLSGKLKLNTVGGVDVINIRNLKIKGDDHNRMPASADSTVAASNSWRDTIVFGLLILGLFAAYYYFFVYKKKQEEMQPDLTFNKSEGGADGLGDDSTSSAESSLEKIETLADKLERQHAGKEGMSEEDLAKLPSLLVLPTSPNAEEFVSKLKTLVNGYPKITSEALQTFVDQNENKIHQVAYAIELLGFETALMLFSEVSHRHWRIIGAYMADNPVSNEHPIDIEEAAKLYRYMVGRIIENKGLESDTGVFSVDSFGLNDLMKVLESENDFFVAQFIAGVSDSMAEDILSRIVPSRKPNILTMMSSINELDPDDIEKIESVIQEKLSEDKLQTVAVSNEARIFASLASLSPHEEESLFSSMVASDPGILLRSQMHRLYQQHLASIRGDILEEELSTYPIEGIARLMKGMDEETRDAILSNMSQKKGMVLVDMLDTMRALPDGPEYAESRRDFLDYIYGKYSQGGKSFIKNIFKSSINEEDSGGYDAA